MILEDELCHYLCTTAMSKRYLELIPKLKLHLHERADEVTLTIEGLNFDLPEALLLERLGRFRGHRYQWCHFGIVGIKFK